MQIPKPILKWVGGKSQIIHPLLAEFPSEINNYHELFLGGGSVLLALLSHIQNNHIRLHGKIFAYDINPTLIHTFIHIQQHPDELYNAIQNLISHFLSCQQGEINRNPPTFEDAILNQENYYYWLRNRYNQMTTEQQCSIYGAALFIFLNKTCFRGVFRIGPRGFNVPYGHYKNPEIINRDHLFAIHHLIQGVVFQCMDFRLVYQQTVFEDGDFIYLDPPYAPETSTSFVGYTHNGFTMEDHLALFQFIHTLSTANEGKKQMLLMSNADVPFVREHFTDTPIKYQIKPILCKRSIHSKNPQSTAKEVFIKNY